MSRLQYSTCLSSYVKNMCLKTPFRKTLHYCNPNKNKPNSTEEQHRTRWDFVGEGLQDNLNPKPSTPNVCVYMYIHTHTHWLMSVWFIYRYVYMSFFWSGFRLCMGLLDHLVEVRLAVDRRDGHSPWHTESIKGLTKWGYRYLNWGYQRIEGLSKWIYTYLNWVYK